MGIAVDCCAYGVFSMNPTFDDAEVGSPGAPK
jgi:hypothetical protein